jgi:hypothetical protein
MTTETVERVLKFVNDAIALRKPDEKTAQAYAEKMEQGIKFPPIILGQWPKSEKYGESGIIDGMHRLNAAILAKLKDIDVQIVKYESLEQALADMYTRNMQHGLPPSEGQRNKRIKLLKQINPQETVDTLAKAFALNRSSIARILKDQQGEGKSGRKGGATANAAHKSLSALLPKQFFASLERFDYTLNKVRATADIIAYVTPQGENGPILDKDKKKKLDSVIKQLLTVQKEIEKVV